MNNELNQVNLSNFVKTKEYLVCVDSDGCAMDTMDIKHFNCFGPCMVKEWGLEEWAEPILKRWNDINLFQMTRGINRFKGLAIALEEISQKYTPIIGVKGLQQWVDTALALSNDGLVKAILDCDDDDTMEVLVEALVIGPAVFKGTDPIDSYRGLRDSHM